MSDLEPSESPPQEAKSDRLIMVDFLGADVNPTDPKIMRLDSDSAHFFERLKHHADVWEPDITGKGTMMQVNQILTTEICGYLLVMSDPDQELTQDNCARVDAARDLCSSLIVYLKPISEFRYPILKALHSIDMSGWNGVSQATVFQELLQWVSALKERTDVVPSADGEKTELPPEPGVETITDIGPGESDSEASETEANEIEDAGHEIVVSELSAAVFDEIAGRLNSHDWSLAQSRNLLEKALPDKEIEPLNRAAGQTHWPCVTILGIARLLGYGVKRDRTAALKHFERASKLGGFPRAMREYGCLLDNAPPGITRDTDLARHWLDEAAGAGIVKAKTDLARHLFGSKVGRAPDTGVVEPKAEREAKAVALLLEAQEFDVQAQGLLGWAIFNGRGTRQSVDQGQSILHRAAASGDAVAAFVIADAYLRGQNTNKDPEVAFRWFKKSAQRGHPHAPFYIGWMLWFGVGTEPSYREATEWMEKAAELGDQAASLYIAEAKMRGLDGPVDMAGAVSVLEAASETNPTAAAELGDAYLFGRGVPENEQRALKLYKDAALKPDTDVFEFRDKDDIKSNAPARALVGLGRILEAGRLQKRNRAGAITLFKAATTRTKDYRLLHDAYTQLYHLGERPQPR